MAGFFHEGSKNGASGGRKKFSIPALTIGRNKLTIEKEVERSIIMNFSHKALGLTLTALFAGSLLQPGRCGPDPEKSGS